MKHRFLSFSLALLMTSASVFAADGDLDTSYSTPTGFNTVSFGASDNVYGGVLQPDGKMIVIGGARPATNQEMSVARFNADGTLDTATFGSGTGKFSIDINPATTTDRGTCGGLQNDGKIIIGGYTRVGSGNDDYAIIRLNANGTLDATFGTSGITKVDFNGGTDRANALVVLSDNSIVITGMSSDFNASIDIDFSVAKLTSNGALDTSFDTDGKMTVDVGDQQDTGNGIAVQSDGKIVFCGQSFGTGTTSAVVGRLTSTGALDTTFGGGDGLYVVTNSTPYDLRDVKVQSDGKIVAVGSATDTVQLDALMLRLTSTGVLDTTFNSTGIRTFPFGTLSDLFLSVLIQADGKYIAGGFWQNPTPNLIETVLVRVTPAGALDSGFGTGGSKQIALGSGNNRPAMIGQASDGKILVALEGGTSSAENFLAARFHNTVAATTTTVTSLNRVNSATTNLSTVNWTLTFAAANTGVSASNFSLSGTASSGASVGNPTTANAGLTWNVPVTTGSSSGTLTLNLANATGTAPGVSTTLPFAGESYTMDKTSPTIGIGLPSVSSIAAGAGSVTYTVTYADANFSSSTLANGNITLNTTGTASGTVGVSGSGLTRTVTLSSITGAGTLGISIASGTASDGAGNLAPASSASTTFAVTAPAPTISSVTGPAGGTYLTGQTLNFTVNYSAAVTVVGSPQLPLTIGSTARNATYASGSGSTALVFSYTVQGTDLDVNGIASASPLVLNGGTIKNGSTDASLTFTPPNTSNVLLGLQRVRNNISSGISVFVRPGGTSYTWTFGTGNNGTGPFTPILDWAFDNVPAFGWNLTRAHMEYSTNGGVNWTTHDSTTVNFTPVAGTLWRCVDTTPGDPTTTNTVGNHWHLVATPGSTTGSGGNVIPDNAPTDITSDKSTIFSTAATNDTVATVTPVDTGDTLGGSWAIDSQSVPNLFTLTFDNTTGNTATLKRGTGTVPGIGQTPTVTLRYYDVYQTDNSGVPIPGQGFSKTLTYTVVSEVSNDLTLGNDIPVNTFTTNTQSSPAVAALTTGNLAVVWQSASQGGKSPTTNSGIYGQLISNTGAAVGSEFVVSNAGAAVDEIAPAVTALASGRYVVAYSKKSGADYDIGYRIVEANGTVGAQLIANSTTAGDQSGPSIVTLTDGSFVIAWYSGVEIRARQFAAAAGAPVTGEVLFDSNGYYTSVAALSNGGYAVAWADGTSGEVKVKVNGGSTVGTGISSAYYAGPRIAGLTGGGFVLASESYDSGTARSQVEAARYNNSGVIQGAKFQVNTVSTGNRYEASVAALTGGGFVVGWAADNGDFDLNGLFGRRYTSGGVAVDASEFQVNQHRAGDQSYPAMTAMPNDAFATVWTDSSAGTPSGDIEARILTVAALSNNADLSALTLTTATINEAFAANTTAYTSSVPNATSSVTVTPTRAQANATIEARVGANAFATVNSGSPSASLPLAVGANTIQVRVTAQDGTTTKTYSIVVTRAAGVPGAPTVGTATAGTNANATVTFTAPASDGGSPITSYSVTSAPGGVVNVGTTSPITISGLTPGIVYTFRVQAFNANGPSALSAASNSITAVTVPGAPTIGTATAGNATASVAFTAPGSTGGSAILDYTVTSSPGGITATSATSPISVTGLTNGTPYTFTVTARNAVGNGAASSASNSVTPSAPADIPVNLSGGTLTLDASGSGSGANTTFRVVNDPGGPFLEISDPGRTLGVPAGGTAVNPNTVRIPLSSVTNLTITGSNSPDKFTFDFTDGDPLPTGSIQVHGGLPVFNPPNPGDSIVVTGGSFTDGTYGPGSGGNGQAILDTNVIDFTGLEPVDLSGSSFVNFTVNVDPTNTFVGNVITTISAVDTGVNTEITFGSSGLESTKIGAVTGTLTIDGDNVDNDYFLLKGLGTAMVGDFSVDGKGGNADVVDISDTTVTVAGLNKDFSAKADFVGLGRQSTAPTLLVGNLICSGDITLEADGDITATPVLWGSGGVWGASRPVYFSNTPIVAERGSVAVGGAISKTSGTDATCTIKAKAAVVLPLYATIISTSNKLHVVLNSDTDATSGGAVSIAQQNIIRSNGGNITIGGGADPATTPAIGSATGGNLPVGVTISASEVTSAGGNISIRGTGRAATNGVGVNIAAQQINGASVIDSGSGTLTIVGTGGGDFTGASGVRLAGAANGTAPLLDGAAFYFAKIRSSTGTISVSGIAAGGNNIGITAGNWTEITSSGLANISVSGTGFGTGAGISLSPGASVSTHLGTMTATSSISSAGGNVTLTADKMALNAGAGTESIATNGTGSVTLKPLTAALVVDLGSTVDTASALELGTLELDNVTAPTLVIGDSTSGSINVSAVISPLNFKTLALANNTTFAAAGGFTSDVTSNSVYEKVTVTGTVNIAAGAAFTAAPVGGYVWNGTDTFTLLDNDASDAITGTVTPTAIPNLLGSALSGIIRYNVGTNANDITIGSMSIIEGWRQTYFNSTENAGNAANSADSDSDGKSNLLEFAFGTIPTNIGSGPGNLVYTGTLAGNGTLTATGQNTTVFEPTTYNVDFRGLFVRRKDYVAAGLTYTPQFSADMQSWQDSAAVPTVLADDGTWEIVSVPYIRSIGGRKARFFRMSVSIAP